MAREGREGVVVRVLDGPVRRAAPSLSPSPSPSVRKSIRRAQAEDRTPFPIAHKFEYECERLEVGPGLRHPAEVGGRVGHDGPADFQRQVAQGAQGKERLDEIRERAPRVKAGR